MPPSRGPRRAPFGFSLVNEHEPVLDVESLVIVNLLTGVNPAMGSENDLCLDLAGCDPAREKREIGAELARDHALRAVKF